MYVSTILLNQAWEKYKRNRVKNREGYEGNADPTVFESSGAGFVAALDSFLLVLGIIFFVLELVVLVYAIMIAINCTRGGAERIVHLILSVTFTLPYVLVMSVFNNCAKSVLRGGAIERGDVSTYSFGGKGCGCSIDKL